MAHVLKEEAAVHPSYLLCVSDAQCSFPTELQSPAEWWVDYDSNNNVNLVKFATDKETEENINTGSGVSVINGKILFFPHKLPVALID